MAQYWEGFVPLPDALSVARMMFGTATHDAQRCAPEIHEENFVSLVASALVLMTYCAGWVRSAIIQITTGKLKGHI